MGSKEKKKRIVLLDSHAILHRAYHAIPDFSSSKGEPTGALYGLVTMLLKMVGDLKPDYVVAARDLPGGTFRDKMYDAYKATRKDTELELIDQLKKAPSVFEAFGIPVYSAPGFEADDVIGTIVKQLQTKDDVDVVIVTGDMDTLQLVNGKRVQVYTLRQGITDTILYDEDRVRERYGFGPKNLIDYKGLRGDPSDNIKGIAGVGEKTATDLITAFGTIEDMYNVAHKDPDEFKKQGIKPRILQLLLGGEKEARLSKELATIHSEAPIAYHIPKEGWRLSDHVGSVSALCDRLEFRSLKERVETAAKRSAEKVETGTLDFDGEEEKREEDVDSEKLKEAAVAVWLLNSDLTSPTLADVLTYAETRDFEKACEVVFEKLRKTGTLWDVYEKIEKPLIPIVDRMNKDGIAIDSTYLAKLEKEYAGELAKIATRIYKHAGREFNISSPKQLGTVLFDELKLAAKVKKTATGARSTREEELSKLKDLHPIIGDILQFRELQKLLSTYVEKMPKMVGEDRRLHATFLQAGTTTGRMASTDPNMQNIPIRSEYGQRIRNAFVGSEGCVLVAIDYSQIELRVAAGLSGDAKLVDVFKRGGDIHTAVASQVFAVPPEHVDKEMRRRAKVINFGILYGMGVNALRVALGEGVTREEASKFLAEYFASYPDLSRFVEKTKQTAERIGYTETLFGRRRYFPGFKSRMPALKAQAERMAVNAPIQGTQSDIIKLAMVEADHMIEKKGWRQSAKLVLQVHDELVYEVEEKKAEEIGRAIKEIMESSSAEDGLSGVPIVAEMSIGQNWGEMRRVQ
ncbi:hypothetical protein HY969_00735 [Candidatus Kaiserbacteria bacterium]|nr:hypothetical protein [Candidatus Kaiserbacteria bacterium]